MTKKDIFFVAIVFILFIVFLVSKFVDATKERLTFSNIHGLAKGYLEIINNIDWNDAKEIKNNNYNNQINPRYSPDIYNGKYVDSWGIPLEITLFNLTSNLGVKIVSAGRDNILGTQDDISVEYCINPQTSELSVREKCGVTK